MGRSHDFTEGSLRVGCILKSVEHFFQGDRLAGLLVDGLQTSGLLQRMKANEAENS